MSDTHQAPDPVVEHKFNDGAELITMIHPDLPGQPTQTTTREALQTLWRDQGWVAAEDFDRQNLEKMTQADLVEEARRRGHVVEDKATKASILKLLAPQED